MMVYVSGILPRIIPLFQNVSTWGEEENSDFDGEIMTHEYTGWDLGVSQFSNLEDGPRD